MSVQAMAWVLEREATTQGTERLVLLVLANHANEAGECWPSVGRIAREAGLRRPQTVQAALRNLEKAGLITTVRQAAPDSRIRSDRRPNLYRFCWEAGDNPHSGGADGVSPRRDGGARAVETGVREPLSTGVRDAHPKSSVLQPSPNRGDGRPDEARARRHGESVVALNRKDAEDVADGYALELDRSAFMAGWQSGQPQPALRSVQ